MSFAQLQAWRATAEAIIDHPPTVSRGNLTTRKLARFLGLCDLYCRRMRAALPMLVTVWPYHSQYPPALGARPGVTEVRNQALALNAWVVDHLTTVNDARFLSPDNTVGWATREQAPDALTPNILLRTIYLNRPDCDQTAEQRQSTTRVIQELLHRLCLKVQQEPRLLASPQQIAANINTRAAVYCGQADAHIAGAAVRGCAHLSTHPALTISTRQTEAMAFNTTGLPGAGFLLRFLLRDEELDSPGPTLLARRLSRVNFMQGAEGTYASGHAVRHQ